MWIPVYLGIMSFGLLLLVHIGTVYGETLLHTTTSVYLHFSFAYSRLDTLAHLLFMLHMVLECKRPVLVHVNDFKCTLYY